MCGCSGKYKVAFLNRHWGTHWVCLTLVFSRVSGERCAMTKSYPHAYVLCLMCIVTTAHCHVTVRFNHTVTLRDHPDAVFMATASAGDGFIAFYRTNYKSYETGQRRYLRYCIRPSIFFSPLPHGHTPHDIESEILIMCLKTHSHGAM